MKRSDKNSGRKLISAAIDMLTKNKVSVFFFPEGTRKVEGTLGEFKVGAFKVAMDAGVRIVPVTISGARDIMPPRGTPALGYGEPIIKIHDPIETQGQTLEDLMAKVRTTIESGLTDVDRIESAKTK